MLLSDRVAIVTGGAKGIGRGIALRLAGEGCRIVIADINTGEADNSVSLIKKGGGEGLAMACDVTDSRQVRDAANRVIKEFGKIDILVNNAGALPAELLVEDLPEEEWDKIINLNLKSHFLFCKYVVPHMKAKRYGKIINISSIGAIHPPAPSSHYAAAKSGVLGLTSALAFELASYNICVNAILPGPIRTDFWKPLVGPLPDEDAFFAEFGSKNVPLGRVGAPQDIAGAALFLASELSAFVTGERIAVTGGMPLSPFNPEG